MICREPHYYDTSSSLHYAAYATGSGLGLASTTRAKRRDELYSRYLWLQYLKY
jgi:hypothetical protein